MTQTVTIIDYGSGNLKSAAKAFERAARGTQTNIVVTADADAVRRADRIVLPGVGAFADCKAGLEAVPGMVEVLEERVIRGGAPFLGICVGMQLMAEEGREKGVHKGLGWIEGAIVKLEPSDPGLKVPHMGWNTLSFRQTHPLLAGIEDGENGLHAYFVHSYHLAATNPASLIATADYGQAVTAIVGRDNMFGTQFHPEKSQRLGLTLIGNFLGWSPK
ncbi:imidazole glycerol phosphate synthase subunit HisH [Youhaiella tibetensis]|uniref:Imidazole glycerol phosphate synthase subunit HisH n=1 Tax=Paradevosia tibetensis TaxID=1447062 RepID=A0A5B9DSU8_9HYPH|nr:imidazole glycerol phosphate synthase subunit HisH [Youhaiella tibetensis]QEE22510.1 imidazole glycerol phosphate synthase subunit HisH [Youhaiella tibetensis]GGF41672.1 imidazole glycerol phosphate synthase subunit HisH [Youhaiella tibetensis]